MAAADEPCRECVWRCCCTNAGVADDLPRSSSDARCKSNVFQHSPDSGLSNSSVHCSRLHIVPSVGWMVVRGGVCARERAYAHTFPPGAFVATVVVVAVPMSLGRGIFKSIATRQREREDKTIRACRCTKRCTRVGGVSGRCTCKHSTVHACVRSVLSSGASCP
jgi:hypothetical protein